MPLPEFDQKNNFIENLMTSKAKFFICRNEQCKEKNKKKNPLKKIIFPYKPKKGGSFHCSYCKSEYKEENGNIYYKAANEIVIDNIKAYEDFNTQYETVRIYFPKLVLKNIKELTGNDSTCRAMQRRPWTGFGWVSSVWETGDPPTLKPWDFYRAFK